jgi:hypothetical protein
MGDRLRDSVSDVNEPLTLIPERVMPGNPTLPFTTSILSSPTSTPDVSVRLMDDIKHTNAFLPQLPSTMLPKEQAQTQSGNDRMSGVPSGVPPQVRDHSLPNLAHMDKWLVARTRGAPLNTTTPGQRWKAQEENLYLGAAGRVSSISRWQEKECRS